MINPRLRRGSDGGAAAAQDRWNQGAGADPTPYYGLNTKKSPLKDLVLMIDLLTMLGSVASPVIQANGRLTFEDDLRSGGLLCFTTYILNQLLHWACQQYGHSG